MQASAEQIWGAAREQLRSMLSADTYNLWFAPLHVSSQDNNSIILEVANDFCEVWLKDNYMELLQDVLAVASGRQMQVKFKVASDRKDNNSIILEVSNDFCEVWLKDNYMELLQDVLAVASGRQMQVKFKVA